MKTTEEMIFDFVENLNITDNARAKYYNEVRNLADKIEEKFEAQTEDYENSEDESYYYRLEDLKEFVKDALNEAKIIMLNIKENLNKDGYDLSDDLDELSYFLNRKYVECRNDDF